jgi:hypothetical protein
MFRSTLIGLAFGLLGFSFLVAGCGPENSTSSGKIPEMTLEIYDATGGGLRLASTDVCEQLPDHQGQPGGNPEQTRECVLPPRDFSEALKADCPCDAECLKPYFDHNRNRGPLGTVQMFTPPQSRRYEPGVPSAKHWEHGVTHNVFSFDVELTNFYDRDLTDVAVVLVEISPPAGELGRRQGFEDDRPHVCLKDDIAVWAFGDIRAGETVVRKARLWLPDDQKFRMVGYIVSLSDCPAAL